MAAIKWIKYYSRATIEREINHEIDFDTALRTAHLPKSSREQSVFENSSRIEFQSLNVYIAGVEENNMFGSFEARRGALCGANEEVTGESEKKKTRYMYRGESLA